MKTSLLFCGALAGAMTLGSAPVFAQDAPSQTTVVQPSPPVVVQQPAPAAPSTIVVNNTPSGRNEGSPHLYPGLIWGGLTLWGVSYGAVAIGAAVANDACSANSSLCITGRGILYVPVVGPFVAIPAVNGTGSSTMKTLLALDGAFQAGGLAMMITGIVLSAGAGSTSSSTAFTFTDRKLLVAPYVTTNSAGLGAMGHF